MLLLVTLVAAVQVALAGDHLPPVPAIRLAIYFKTAVKMFHHLANHVCTLYNNVCCHIILSLTPHDSY